MSFAYCRDSLMGTTERSIPAKYAARLLGVTPRSLEGFAERGVVEVARSRDARQYVTRHGGAWKLVQMPLGRSNGDVALLPKTERMLRQPVDALTRQELRQGEDLLMLFHSRAVQDPFELEGFEASLPSEVYPVGEAVRTNYTSDKDDPATRGDRKRKGLGADPEGVQGVWKMFTHEHLPNSGVMLYDTGALGDRTKPFRVVWPSTLVFLGKFDRAEYRPARKKAQWISREGQGWGLWATPDTRQLVAMPDPRQGRVGELLYWTGGRMSVQWGGIEF